MATVQEILKAAGLGDEIAAGLPKEVVTALTGYVSEADTKLTTAQQEAEKAAELRRQAELDKNDVKTYVEQYGAKLTESASLEAKNKALVTYLQSLKDQGFDVTIPEVTAGAKPVVPGSPAIGGNAVDETAILGKVGSVMSQWLDANNEHPPMVLRLDVSRRAREDYLQGLQAAGIAAQAISWTPTAIRLEQPISLSSLPGFEEGLVSVQDAGAQVAATLLDARPGMRVLDACAAPGGKTGHVLERRTE